MAIRVQGNPKFSAVDSLGNPRVGAKLFTYEAGTTTKKATYTDSTLGAANTNPIILDSNGEAQVWCNGAYKFVLAPAIDTDPPASPYWTVDNVNYDSTAASVSDKIFNGSFESGLDGWSTSGVWTIGTGTYARNGTYYVLTNTVGTNNITSSFVEVTPGAYLELDWSFYTSSGNDNIVAYVEAYDYTQALVSTTLATWANSHAGGIPGWKDKYAYFTVPATAQFIKIKFEAVLLSANTLVLDGVYLYNRGFLTNIATVSGAWTFTGTEVHSGTETHSGTVSYTGSVGLSAIDQVLSGSAVVKHVIIDTTRDSDPNWAESTKHLSYGTETVPSGSYKGRYANEAAARAGGGVANDWYARTATTDFYRLDGSSGETQIYRAGRANFPKLALALAEADRVVIYDLTTSAPQMWMVFTRSATNMLYGTNSITSLSYSDGVLVVGTSGDGVSILNFGLGLGKFITAANHKRYNGNISQRNSSSDFVTTATTVLVGATVNDVASVVLTTAPIKPHGLKEPTIVVGTNSGTSVIKDDGNIWDITEAGYNEHKKVSVNNNHVLLIRKQDVTDSWVTALCPIPIADTTITASILNYNTTTYSSTATPTQLAVANDINSIYLDNNKSIYGVASQGLVLVERSKGTVPTLIWNNTTKDYCTGWLHGDIRRALLANSKTADRSVKASTLTENGTVTESTLTGSDLKVYSGFSGTNYLSQAYSADLDFGTADWSVSFWLKETPNSATEMIFSRGYYSGGWSGGGQLEIYLDATGILGMGLSDDNYVTTDFVTSTFAVDDSQYHKIDLVRSGGVVNLYIDGVYNATKTLVNAVASLSNASGVLRLGLNSDGGSANTNGTQSLFRISTTALTADQIKYAYETELPIFQGNNCLLSGSSNDVLTIAYDQVKDTVHAGTSSGRSEFKGLVRVGYEATPVGNPTSIVAHTDIISNGGATGSDIYIPQLDIREKLIEDFIDKDKDVVTRNSLGYIDSSINVSGTINGVQTYLATEMAFGSQLNIPSIIGAAWESVGPTGSGATNIWPAMDYVQSGAKAVILKTEHYVSGSTSGQTYTSTLYGRKTGSSASAAANTQVSKVVDTNNTGTSQQTGIFTICMIPLDSLRRFDLYLAAAGTGVSQTVYSSVIGWII